MNNKNTNFDFEEMSHLAKNDPEEFEKKRKILIKNLIDQSPKSTQQRLKHLQWKCDAAIQSSKTPLQSCLRINSMLMDMFYKDGGFKDQISEFAYLINQFKKSTEGVIQKNEK